MNEWTEKPVVCWPELTQDTRSNTGCRQCLAPCPNEWLLCPGRDSGRLCRQINSVTAAISVTHRGLTQCPQGQWQVNLTIGVRTSLLQKINSGVIQLCGYLYLKLRTCFCSVIQLINYILQTDVSRSLLPGDCRVACCTSIGAGHDMLLFVNWIRRRVTLMWLVVQNWCSGSLGPSADAALMSLLYERFHWMLGDAVSTCVCFWETSVNVSWTQVA